MIAEPMELQTRIFVILLGVAVAFFVINQVRTRKIKEQYALLWILTAILLVLVPIFVDVVDAISYALGILYPPAFIFLIALVCILLILFQFSMSISRFSEQIKVLVQEIALLTKRVEELEGRDSDEDGKRE
ncbi:MAG: DUF2304 domain-containing protein [Chloroflexota bacterium]|nr:DUF2304 domain-containing protein [Anaerolineae bacterium]